MYIRYIYHFKIEMKAEHLTLQYQEATQRQILSVLPLETQVKFIFHNSPTPGWVPGRVSACGSRRGRKVGSAARKQLTALMIPQQSWTQSWNTHKCIQLQPIDSDMLALLLSWIPCFVIRFRFELFVLKHIFLRMTLEEYF